MTVDNSTGANVRADINSALQALATNSSGSSAPSTTFASQFFADTNAGIMKLRNTSNNGFVNLFTLAGGIDVDAASTFSEDVTFEGASANIKFDKSDNALEFRDNMKAKFGDGDDLSIFHNGSHSIIAETGTGNLQLRCADFRVTNADNTETIITGNTNGAVELYFDNVARLGTSSTGVTVVGVLSTTSHIKLPDNVQLQMGDAGTNDFILLHDGTDNIINCTNNGNLFQRASSIHLQSQTAENMAIGEANGAFEAYFDNSKKANTSSDGFNVVGIYSQEKTGFGVVYHRQIGKLNPNSNSTQTVTITNMSNMSCRLYIGVGDGNFHFGGYAAIITGTQFSSVNGYFVTELQNDRSGMNNFGVTKTNTSFAVTVNAGSNQVFGSVILESNGASDGAKPTLTIS